MLKSKTILSIGLLATTALISGCGDDSAPNPSGRLVQGPVSGATIFADNVSAGARFKLDSAEVSTISDSAGNFTLPSTPGYNYIIVSQGGTDTITNRPAIQMIAPAGSANVTPITTLVALDTTGNLKAKLEALMPAGTKFDTDISKNASSAVLLLSKSIETAVEALTNAITTKAGANNITATQIASIQAETMQSIASTLNSSTTLAGLAAPAALTTTMTTALSNAITNINTNNSSNISIPSSDSTTIANNAVGAAAAALGTTSSSTTALSTSTATLETTLVSAGQFTTAVTNTVTTLQTNINVTTTPTNFTPPTIPVTTTITVNNTGSTGTGTF